MEAKLNRRDFLGRTAGAAAGVAVMGASGSAWAGGSVAPQVRQPAVAGIGLQMYTIGDQTREDMIGAIERVSTIGYKVLEFAGYGSATPAQIRAALDRLGMTSPSTHTSLALLRNEFEAQASAAETIGHKYITVPSLGGAVPTTADGWKAVADEFNEMGTRLKARGIGLAFHSHRDEFLVVGDGKKGMDLFIAGTDPGLVTFEIDLGWATVAGENPVDWFGRYPGRVRMWHVKDILALTAAQERQVETFQRLAAPPAPAAEGGRRGGGPGGAGRGAGAPPAVTGGPVPIGAGEIDYKPIFAEWRVSGLEYFFVEQDGAANWPGGSLVAVATSYRNLVNLLT